MQPDTPPPQVTPKMLEAFDLADGGMAKSAVARQLGLARSTLYRWLDDPAARAAVDTKRADAAAEQRRSRQDRAIEMMVKGDRICDIAAAVGVDRRTVWRWAQQPEFAAEVRGARDSVVTLAGLGLAEAALDAVRVLVAIMNDNDAPVRERRQAADAVLARAFGMPGEVHAAAVQMKPQVALEPITIPPRPELSPKALHQVARIILMDEMRQRHGDDAVVDDEDEDEGPPN